MQTEGIAWKPAICYPADNVMRIYWAVLLLATKSGFCMTIGTGLLSGRIKMMLQNRCRNWDYTFARSWPQFGGQPEMWCITVFPTRPSVHFWVSLYRIRCQISQAFNNSLRKSPILLHSDARPQVALQTLRKLTECGCAAPPHPMYSSDSSPFTTYSGTLISSSLKSR